MTRQPRQVRVVVVEDSSVHRARIVRALEADDDIQVVGEVADAGGVLAAVREHRPDVVTMDLQIPGGGGLHAVEQIMGFAPTPILVVSASGDASQEALDALVAGALEALPKPIRWTAVDEDQLRRRVRALAGATVLRHPRARRGGDRKAADERPSTAMPVVAVAASTGGPPAVADLLARLGGLQAAVLVVQHLHADFIDGFVAWMARASALPVQPAGQGTIVQRGGVYIAPAGSHLRLGRDCRLTLSAEPRSLHRPSADVLFESVAAQAGARAIGVLLTGMGDDGARGLLALRNAGALTIAQDEATSAVWGMPRAAVALDAARRVLPLSDIPDALLRAVRRLG
ncbi:MAG TPA: chemotaxis protein CheB [Acidimicrobiales bacterium]|nr:chemotaxis protein CheB [Acidimicrobiales bacterium]